MITYFVLKDDGGKTAGCVRLENGRARSNCPCTLLLEDGSTLTLGTDETALPAGALGAAVLRGDALMAWGTAPGLYAHTGCGNSLAQWSMMVFALSKPASETLLSLLPS